MEINSIFTFVQRALYMACAHLRYSKFEPPFHCPPPKSLHQGSEVFSQDDASPTQILCIVLFLLESWDWIACEQVLDERGRKGEGLHACLRFYNIWYNFGSATEMIINITLVDDFVTFSILNCKNYLYLSIKLQFNDGNNKIYQNKVCGNVFS